MGPWHPMPDPAMQQMQVEAQQAELAKTAAITEETKAKTVARLVDAQYKQQGANAPAMQKMKWLEMFNQQKVRMQEEAHLQQMIHLQEQQDIQAANASNDPIVADLFAQTEKALEEYLDNRLSRLNTDPEDFRPAKRPPSVFKMIAVAEMLTNRTPKRKP